MKQTAHIISTYTADVSGVCSALFELGGMTIMHDASGCNSTYNTHDEPRWYDMDSMVYISGLSELEAIMGDDNKLVSDIVTAANELQPRFITIAGSPIPMVIGTDFDAIASMVEAETGIPAIGIATNGMHSYLLGAGEALAKFAKRFCKDGLSKSADFSINILGATPLDFSVNGAVNDMKALFEAAGMRVISTWAMGSTFDALTNAGEAHVNLVVSYAGLPAAKVLYEKYGTPYVVGVPFGENFSKRVIEALRHAAQTGNCSTAYDVTSDCCNSALTIIGESVSAASLAEAYFLQTGKRARIICPLETEMQLLPGGALLAEDETEIMLALQEAKVIAADPLYKPICPATATFLPLPHEAFSGRIYREDIPNFIGRTITL